MANRATQGEEEEEDSEELVYFLLLSVHEKRCPVEHINVPVGSYDSGQRAVKGDGENVVN